MIRLDSHIALRRARTMAIGEGGPELVKQDPLAHLRRESARGDRRPPHRKGEAGRRTAGRSACADRRGIQVRAS